MSGRLLSIDRVPPGASLAADVCDGGGRVLLAAGATLDVAAIAALCQRGVAQVCIAAPDDPEAAAAQRDAAIARLGHLFRYADADPLMARLHEVVRNYRLGRSS